MPYKYKNTLTILALMVTAWASLATSTSTPSIDSGQLYVISDCVTPNLEREVTVSGGVITSGGDYTQFGFPTSAVHLGQEVNGPINNGTGFVARDCVQSYGDNSTRDNSKYIYSCLDDGQYACAVTIIPQ